MNCGNPALQFCVLKLMSIILSLMYMYLKIVQHYIKKL